MLDISIWQILIVLSFLATFVVLYFVVGSILRKAGVSRWWAISLLIPLLNIIMVWVFAFMKWPSESNDAGDSSDQSS